ncbi:MAG TPA: acVLRF1 family peptidyl-tRNA hydrolase [Marmoricola sp.]|nr:acVLRF1 family peptidyl-tRNA hydrolase [Marmoricola sp.]HNO39057.1 acVLRF1 family peptidyl-tRNA hydrolase [Marmoricola sp.]
MKLLLPPARLTRWVSNFESQHGTVSLRAEDQLYGLASDGSAFTARLPFDLRYQGPAQVNAFMAAATPPTDWGLLLVRRAGYVMARLAGPEPGAHKISKRWVQGRSKAGGQSQQRFARRRENQAQETYKSAATSARTLLAGAPFLVTGGDRLAVEETIRLAGLNTQLDSRRLPHTGASRDLLGTAIQSACALELNIKDVTRGH